MKTLVSQQFARLFLLSILCAGVNAQETSVATPILANQGTYLVQVFVGLIFVIGLIFSMGWLLKRMGQGTIGGGQHLKVLASLSLGTREKIALIQVGDQQLLLGITPNAINNLQTFEEPVISGESKENNSEFSRKLKTLLSNKPVQP